MSSGWSDPRPLSPHLQVWKPHLTMITSISHRITGAALYFGSALIALWIVALGLGPDAAGEPPALYGFIDMVVTSIWGQVLLVLWAAAVLFHFANGIRHLIWDGPRAGFEPGAASGWSAFIIFFALAGAVGLWAAATLL